MLEKYDPVWSEEDINIDLVWEKFGIYLQALQPTNVFPKRIFHYWMEYFELPLLKENECVEKAVLKQK